MAIVELALDQLEHGALAEVFSSGAAAALIKADGLVRRLWERLMGDPQERLPWENPLGAIASNHHGAADITAAVGDVLYFRPGLHGHIARKFEISRHSGQLSTNPAWLDQDGQMRALASAEVLKDCWHLSDRIMSAMTPSADRPPDCRVTVQRLKYQRDLAMLDNMTALVTNSLGRWGRLGFAIDTARARAAGPLATKGLSDLFGLISQLPLVSEPIRSINTRLTGRSAISHLADGQHLIEKAHYDSRYFSAICGSRDTIRTQVYDSGEWINLPIAPDTMAIFPGRLAKERLGISPTLHRVVHYEPKPDSTPDITTGIDARYHNTTLLIGTK